MPKRVTDPNRWRPKRHRYTSKAYRLWQAWWSRKYLGALMSEELYVASNQIGFARRLLDKQDGIVRPAVIRPRPVREASDKDWRKYSRHEIYRVPT